jgi:hypothetical protein
LRNKNKQIKCKANKRKEIIKMSETGSFYVLKPGILPPLLPYAPPYLASV